MTGFFGEELLISPRVLLLVMLFVSNGLDGLAALPVMPKESMDPMRFWRAWSAMDPPLVDVAVPLLPSRPSEERFPIVKAGLVVVVGAGG